MPTPGVILLTKTRVGRDEPRSAWDAVKSRCETGMRNRVFLDGGPVGGIDPDELNVTRDLAAAGVEVRWLKGGSDVVKRYRFLHAKYAIVDARAAWIGSENFGEAGFPSGVRGNRGWSVL